MIVKNRTNPWISIIACLIVQMCVGILYLWSALRSDIVLSFAWKDSAAGMVSSYMIFAFVFGNLIGGFINDKFGPRVTCLIGVIFFAAGVGLTGLLTPATVSLLNLTYAVMAGLGSGIAYGSCISCIQKWLPHKMGLASGLACSAFGLSTVVFTPVSSILMDAFRNASGVVDFKPVFLILAGVFAVLGIGASLFINLPNQDYIDQLPPPPTAPGSGLKDFTLKQMLKTGVFWAFFFSIFFINGTWNLCVPLIRNLGIVRGLTPAMALFCVSFTGITNAAGRLVMAGVSDKLGRYKTMYLLSILTMIGALLLTKVGGFGYFLAIALVAFAYGGPSAVNAALSTALFGFTHAGVNYGVAMLALGFSSVFFNFIANHVINAAVDVAAGTAVGIMPTFIMGAITAIIPIFLIMYIKYKVESYVEPEKKDAP